MKITELRKNNSPIIYKQLSARLFMAGKHHVTIIFESKQLPPINMTNEELENAFGQTLFFVQDRIASSNTYNNITPEQQVEHFRKQTYLRALFELTGDKKCVGGEIKRQKAIDIAAVELNDCNPPCVTSLYTWVKIESERQGGIAGKIISGEKRQRTPSYGQQVMNEALIITDEYFIRPNPESYSDIHRRVVARLEELNIKKIPSYVTTTKWIKSLCPIDIINMCMSPKERKKALRNAVKKFLVKRPLERVEADGIYVQVGVVDVEGNYLGAVTIIFVIDVATRSILGYEMHIGSGEPSSTVIGAYRHAFCPKIDGSYYTQRGERWYCYGVPELLVVDGGPGFSSVETHSYALNYFGSIIETVPAYAGWCKPFIERFNSTFRRSCASKIPGYVGPMKDQKLLEHSIEEQAVLTIDGLRRIIESWIVDQYHNTPHSGLYGKNPCESWQDALDSGWIPEVPVDIESVMLPAGKTVMRTISGEYCHLGVVIENVRYNDEDGRLKLIGIKISQMGDKPVVTCRYDKNDISAITVVDPFNNEDFIVNCTHQDIPKKMTLVEYQARSTDKSFNTDAPSVMDEHSDVIEGRKLHEKKTKSTPTKIRKAIPENYEDEIARLAADPNSEETPDNGASIDDYSNPLDAIDLDKVKKSDAT